MRILKESALYIRAGSDTLACRNVINAEQREEMKEMEILRVKVKYLKKELSDIKKERDRYTMPPPPVTQPVPLKRPGFNRNLPNLPPLFSEKKKKKERRKSRGRDPRPSGNAGPKNANQQAPSKDSNNRHEPKS